MSRRAVLLGGVTLGSLVALMIRAGLRERRDAEARSPLHLSQPRGSRSLTPLPDSSREDVLDRYRLAAAV